MIYGLCLANLLCRKTIKYIDQSKDPIQTMFPQGDNVFFLREFGFSLRIATGGDPPLPSYSSRTSRWVINKKKSQKPKILLKKQKESLFELFDNEKIIYTYSMKNV